MEGAAPLVNVGTLVSGLLIAGTTGLFWFAYTHPRSYTRVSLIVLVIVAIANLVSVGIAIGYRNGAEHAFRYAELPDPKPAFEVDPLGWMPMLVFGGLTLLILFLQFIHKLKDD